MTTPEAIDLTPTEATARVHQSLDRASERLRIGDLEPALGAYARALGLALQLGPAPTEKVLLATLDAAHRLARRQNAEGLSALGPTLVGLVSQVRDTGALPPTAVNADKAKSSACLLSGAPVCAAFKFVCAASGINNPAVPVKKPDSTTSHPQSPTKPDKNIINKIFVFTLNSISLFFNS